MADRMDDEHGAPVGGLSIWVGLATFFSNSQERNRAHEAVKQARQVSRQHDAERAQAEPAGQNKGSSRRFGSWFGLSSKKDKDKGKVKTAKQETESSTPVSQTQTQTSTPAEPA